MSRSSGRQAPPRGGRSRRRQPGRLFDAVGIAPPLVAPASSPSPIAAPALIDPAAALTLEFITIGRFEKATRLGRLLPHLDEAYAALFGAARWAAYLDWSGSGAVAPLSQEEREGEGGDGGGLGKGARRWRHDFAPAPVRRRFDVDAGRLFAVNARARPPKRRDLVDGLIGPWRDEVLAKVTAAAAAPLGPDGTLADPGIDWDGVPAWDVWRFDRARLIAAADPAAPNRAGPVSGLAKLIDLAMEAKASCPRREGEPIDDLTEEAFASLLEGFHLARGAIAAFEGLRRAHGYRLEEPVGERLSTFAGGQLADAVFLAAARLPGFAPMLQRAGLGPGLVLPARLPPAPRWADFRRPVWTKDACEAAFTSIAGLAAAMLVDHRPCDLAAGLAHLRQMAYALVASDAKAAGLVPDRDEPDAEAELTFWLSGIEAPGGPGAIFRVHGIAPLISLQAFGIEVIEAEPAYPVRALAEARRAFGLETTELDIVFDMRAREGGRTLPPFVLELGDVAKARAAAFKTARARRLLAERRGAGYSVPERAPEPDAMPDLGSPLDEAILRLVAKDKCLPRLGPHPDPRAAYQLEDPDFVIYRRIADLTATIKKKRVADGVTATAIAPLVEEIVAGLKRSGVDLARWRIDVDGVCYPAAHDICLVLFGRIIFAASGVSIGATDREVTVVAQCTMRAATIIIADDGPALARETVEAINRLPGSHEADAVSAGLLATARDLVAATGGRFVLSARDRGGMRSVVEWSARDDA